MAHSLWSREALSDLVADERPWVRRWALERLGNWYPAEAGVAIAGAITDPDPDVARLAIELAGELHVHDAQDALLGRFLSDDEPLAVASAASLGLLQDERLLDAISARWAQERLSPEARIAALLAASFIDGPGAREALDEELRATGLGGSKSAHHLILALTRAKGDGAAEWLARELTRDHPQHVVDGLIEGLVPFTGHALSAADLTDLARGRDPVRARAIVQPLLRRLPDLVREEWVDELALAWSRRNGSRVLALLGDVVRDLSRARDLSPLGRSAFTMLATLSDEPQTIADLSMRRQREIACLALLGLAHVESVLRFDRLLAAGDLRVLLEVVLAGELSDATIHVALHRLSEKEPTAEMVAACADALHRAPTPGAEAAACTLLGAWKVTQALPLLVEALGRDRRITNAAVEALTAYGDLGLAGLRTTLEKDQDRTRIAASLEVCSGVPSALAVDLVATNFRRLWKLDPDGMAMVVETLAAPEFLAPLETEASRGDPEASHLRGLLRDLHGLDTDAPAPAVPPGPVTRDHPKVGRNDPCPCGSGRKYKKCCL